MSTKKLAISAPVANFAFAAEEPTPGAQSTVFDFEGVLNNGEDVLPGDTITGEVTTCRFGYEFLPTGFVLAPMNLVVVDENTLAGEWAFDDDGDGEPDNSGLITVTRRQ